MSEKMHKKINNSARSNMSTNKKLKISTISSSNLNTETFSELPHQNTDSSDSDEESVSEVSSLDFLNFNL
jgi:hypothetical protein